MYSADDEEMNAEEEKVSCVLLTPRHAAEGRAAYFNEGSRKN